MASQLHLVRLTREDTSIPWGFRLEGGVDIGHAVNIQHVTPASVAEYCGLRAGDHVVRINRSETKWMRHEDAKMEIIRSANDLDMLVERGGIRVIQASAPVTMLPSSTMQPQTSTTIWQPKIVQRQHISQYNSMDTRTSLEASDNNYDRSIGVSHNVSPVPYGHSPPTPGRSFVTQGTDGRVRQIKHSSYNSPMGLYAESHRNETFQKVMTSVSGGKTRSVARPTGGAAPISDSGTKFCGSCGQFIRDVFVKVQGRIPMHPECLKCCKCSVGLRNLGYFYINDRLYCERHAKQAAPPPEPGMKPVVVYK